MHPGKGYRLACVVICGGLVVENGGENMDLQVVIDGDSVVTNVLISTNGISLQFLGVLSASTVLRFTIRVTIIGNFAFLPKEREIISARPSLGRGYHTLRHLQLQVKWVVTPVVVV
ncbi:hypothetical protein BDN72DRAFT_850822 [Pluteus cervinus]|uniref:Uncharacterized protein n=1 Tax=Pluteus cervinus TaxID=181527 RepID=A0ACD3A3E2_9AGAR|nr:hypothetical protein BDN72DRAFT_850822 [Pluteus cervinus]